MKWILYDMGNSSEYFLIPSLRWEHVVMVSIQQGGIFPGKVGRIFPGSLELSGEVLSKNHALLSQFWDMTRNHALLSQFYIWGMKYWRNILHQKEILGKKLSATEWNFLSQEQISCDRKKFHVTGRNFLLQEEISCHRKKFPLTWQNVRSQQEIACHRKKFPVTGRNFLSQ